MDMQHNTRPSKFPHSRANDSPMVVLISSMYIESVHAPGAHTHLPVYSTFTPDGGEINVA